MLQAIKKTLAYAGIFNYPLTPKEIHRWLIGKKASFKEVKRQKFPKQNFTERKKKAKIAIKKLAIAKKTASLLSKIPTILSILVTGNLSMNNSAIDDDVDLLIITKKNTLWTTRFFANLLTDLIKIRRHPGDKNFKDKICLNMFLDEDHLKITDQNIYTSHELLQAKPIYDKNHTYQKFISANPWAKQYLPNAYEKAKNYGGAIKIFRAQSSEAPPKAEAKGVSTAKFCCEPLIFRAFSIPEPLLSFLQKQYMAKRVTKEKILPGQLLFHPKNTQQKILRKYKSLLTKPDFHYKIAVGSLE